MCGGSFWAAAADECLSSQQPSEQHIDEDEEAEAAMMEAEATSTDLPSTTSIPPQAPAPAPEPSGVGLGGDFPNMEFEKQTCELRAAERELRTLEPPAPATIHKTPGTCQINKVDIIHEAR